MKKKRTKKVEKKVDRINRKQFDVLKGNSFSLIASYITRRLQDEDYDAEVMASEILELPDFLNLIYLFGLTYSKNLPDLVIISTIDLEKDLQEPSPSVWAAKIQKVVEMNEESESGLIQYLKGIQDEGAVKEGGFLFVYYDYCDRESVACYATVLNWKDYFRRAAQ